MKESDLIEGDAELNKHISELVKQSNILELVKMMNPLDIVKVIAISLDLRPIQAAKLTVKLLGTVKEWSAPRN